MADFTYNGIPIFDVEFNDLSTISNHLTEGSRLMGRLIEREDLRDHFIRKGTKFGIRYEGMIIDLSTASYKLKKNLQE